MLSISFPYENYLRMSVSFSKSNDLVGFVAYFFRFGSDDSESSLSSSESLYFAFLIIISSDDSSDDSEFSANFFLKSSKSYVYSSAYVIFPPTFVNIFSYSDSSESLSSYFFLIFLNVSSLITSL